MASDLDKLIRLSPPLVDGSGESLRKRPVSEPHSLPMDHVRLLNAYGTGCFDEFLWIYAEGAANHWLDIGARTDQMKNALTGRVLADVRPRLNEFGLTPEDLICWGGTDNADNLVWLPLGPPENWMTGILDNSGNHLDVFNSSSVRLILDLLLGVQKTRIFPEDFPSGNPFFSRKTSA